MVRSDGRVDGVQNMVANRLVYFFSIQPHFHAYDFGWPVAYSFNNVRRPHVLTVGNTTDLHLKGIRVWRATSSCGATVETDGETIHGSEANYVVQTVFVHVTEC